MDIHNRQASILKPPQVTKAGVRALFTAAVVPGTQPPFDRVQVRAYYPAAAPQGSALDTGIVDVADRFDLLPTVILAGGVNCGPDAYSWLAHHLAASGYCAVTYLYTAPTYRGLLGLVPDDGFGGPNSTGRVTRAVLGAVRDAAARAPLHGHLNLDRVALVGHSAGGRTALYLSQDEQLDLRAVATYAAHAVLRSEEGHPVVPVLDARCPLLIAYGGADGVISRSRTRYGATAGQDWDPAAATFGQLREAGGNHLLVCLPKATHFTAVHPHDTAMGRAFLEEADAAATTHRSVLARVVTAFLDLHLRDGPAAALDGALEEPGLAISRR